MGKDIYIVLDELGIPLRDNDGHIRCMHELLRDIRIRQGKVEQPLLQIELEDEHSLPKVFYKGKEITRKIKIDFDWRTKGLIDLGGLEFNLEYGDDKGIVHKVGRRRGDFR